MKKSALTLSTILIFLLAATPLRGASPLVLALLGDSNLWTGGDDCSGERAWSKWLHDMMPDGTLMRSFARSGATWTNTITTHLDTAAYSERLDDNNVMYNQAMRLIGAVKRGDLPSPDVIILSAGTNDAWFKARRPGIFDIKELTDSMSYTTLPSERTTLVGSLRLVLNLLNHELPGAAMVLITPPYTDRASKEDINIVSKYISEIGCSIGIPLVALNTLSGIDPGREHRKPYLTTDGTHTSPEGAKIIASIIYNALMINKLITE